MRMQRYIARDMRSALAQVRDALGPELQDFDTEIERRQRIQEILG